MESFNGRARDELLNVEELGTLIEARVVVESWRSEYNTYRPHSSLARMTPVEFRIHWEREYPVPACVLAGTGDTTPISAAAYMPT